MNKELNNDTCPDGFQMLGDLYCIHVSENRLAYADASEYCNQKGGSELIYLESNIDLVELLRDPPEKK